MENVRTSHKDVNPEPDLGAVIINETNSNFDLIFEGVNIKLIRKKLISKKQETYKIIILQLFSDNKIPPNKRKDSYLR